MFSSLEADVTLLIRGHSERINRRTWRWHRPRPGSARRLPKAAGCA